MLIKKIRDEATIKNLKIHLICIIKISLAVLLNNELFLSFVRADAALNRMLLEQGRNKEADVYELGAPTHPEFESFLTDSEKAALEKQRKNSAAIRK